MADMVLSGTSSAAPIRQGAMVGSAGNGSYTDDFSQAFQYISIIAAVE